MENFETNSEIREMMAVNDIRQWEVAREIGIATSAFSARLKKEMGEEQREATKCAIESILKRREVNLSDEEKQDAIGKSCRALEELISEMKKYINSGSQVVKEAYEAIDLATSAGGDYKARSNGTNLYGYAPFQKRLCEIVKESPYTIREIAEKTGVGQSTITAWMYRNAGIKTENLVELADFFGVTLDYLVGRTDKKDGFADPKENMRENYEKYLRETKNKQYMENSRTYIAPWPYNLLDDVYQPYEAAPPDDIEDRVLRALKALTPREQKSMLEYYREEKTPEEVASDFCVSRERVRQIIRKGIRKLRHPVGKRILECSEEEIEIMKENNSKKQELLGLQQELDRKIEMIKGKGAEIENYRISEIREKEASDLERRGIEEMDFSIRSYNCLVRANIRTVGDLEKLIREQGNEGLVRIRNLGRKSLEEIYHRLRVVTGEDWEAIAYEADARNARNKGQN